MKTLKAIFLIGLVIAQMQLLLGCSVVMALRQPEKKDLRVLAPGVTRENVMTYLGAPIYSEKTENGKVEMYEFVQGFSGGHKAGRAVFHGFADLFTLFIWELIAMPTEAIWDGKKMTVKIEFDDKNLLKNYIFLKQS